MIFVFFGRCKGVLAYPHPSASYAVPVCQYRILQSRFLYCIPYGKPTCGLLILPGVTPAYESLSRFTGRLPPIGRHRLAAGDASGKIHPAWLPSEYLFAILKSSMSFRRVCSAHAGHTHSGFAKLPKDNRGTVPGNFTKPRTVIAHSGQHEFPEDLISKEK